jgi:hypothetical protein
MSTYRFGKYTATERRNTKTQSIKTLCFSGTLAKKPIYFKCNSPKRENENTDEEKTFPSSLKWLKLLLLFPRSKQAWVLLTNNHG